MVNSDCFLAELDVANIDDILDARDSDPFDAEWCRVNELMNRHKLDASPDVDTLRELVFQRAFAATQSLDACGYISDDFGLIAEVTIAEIPDPWLAALVANYTSGFFPHGTLVGDSRSVAEILLPFTP